MSERKSFSGDYHEMRISGQGYRHLTRFSKFVLFKPAASTMQKINTVGCFNLSSLKVCLHAFISCYLKKIIKMDFQSWRKNSPAISLFFRKMIA